MVNSSLTYEILMYLNSFYFGLYGMCELGMGLLKAVNLSYPEGTLTYEACILIGLFIIETTRIVFGRAGSLSDHCWQVICSVFLTIPSMMGVTYLLAFQHQKLRLEYILCALMLILQTVELVFASIFVCTSCRPISYD